MDDKTPEAVVSGSPLAPILSTPHLIVVTGPRDRAFPLAKGTQLIGRDPEGEIVLRHRTVSWRHASITVGDEIVVDDLGSRNGTFVGVDKIKQRVLRDGDVLGIGDCIALKLIHRSAHGEAEQDLEAREAAPGVANVASLLDRLRNEWSHTQYDETPLILAFFRVEGLARFQAQDQLVIEEIMDQVASTVREMVGEGQLLARAADGELVALWRSTVVQAERLAQGIRSHAMRRMDAIVGPATPPAMTVALVPLARTIALPPEKLLTAAHRRAHRVMDELAGQIAIIAGLDAPGIG